jgi:hypothetical protein
MYMVVPYSNLPFRMRAPPVYRLEVKRCEASQCPPKTGGISEVAISDWAHANPLRPMHRSPETRVGLTPPPENSQDVDTSWCRHNDFDCTCKLIVRFRRFCRNNSVLFGLHDVDDLDAVASILFEIAYVAPNFELTRNISTYRPV